VSLGNGHYRFITANSTLTDVVGNPLDGNGGRQRRRSLQPQLHRCPSSGQTFEGENNDTARTRPLFR